MDDKLISRIRKMVALGNDQGATEGERDTAMRMVYSLLAKHNLSLSSLEDKSETRSINSTHFYGRPWAQMTANAVAQLFFCRLFVRQSGERNMVHYYFVGKESNAVTAMEMSVYLIKSIKREGGARARAAGQGVAYRRSFCLGVVSRLHVRVTEMIQEATQTDSVATGSALALTSLYDSEALANAQFLEEQGLKLKAGTKTSKDVDLNAFSSGQRYGDSINLNRQVTGSNPQATKLIGGQ